MKAAPESNALALRFAMPGCGLVAVGGALIWVKPLNLVPLSFPASRSIPSGRTLASWAKPKSSVTMCGESVSGASSSLAPVALLAWGFAVCRRFHRNGSGLRRAPGLNSVLRAERADEKAASAWNDTTTLGANPAIAQPQITTEYPDEYDLTNPQDSFVQVGKAIIAELIDELPVDYELPEKEVMWITRSLNYNTLGGKMNRGLITVEAGRELMLHQGRTPTSHDLHRFAVLGWAVEFLQACMLMADDMVDGSLTRRGEPCWYKLEDVGLLATNDFLMTEMMVYKIIRRHFGQDSYYPWIIDLFLETTFQTECGQLLDSICANCELSELTKSRWTLVVKYKTAFYSFYLPVALAMLAAGVRDKAAFEKAREVLMVMGIFFQAQDDFLDAFAPPEVLGKVGTDIADKKCSWLFAHAYHEVGDDNAKQLLDQFYGKCEVGSDEEGRIKDLYLQLGLKDLFEKYEMKVKEQVQGYRDDVERVGLPWSVFEIFFAKIFKRKK